MYKKVWIYILIIVVVSSLFPSILIAKADEGEGDNGDLPGREYSFEKAPFPGTYLQFTESAWQAFINKAEEYNHTTIYKFNKITIIKEDGKIVREQGGDPLFFSSNGTDIEDVLIENWNGENQSFNYQIKYKEGANPNIITRNGLGGYYQDKSIINNYSSGTSSNYFLGGEYDVTPWYRADISNDPYQDMPPMYNADPSKGYGMYFVKPSWGEWINIPHKLGTYRDYIEIELQVPRLYVHDDWSTDEVFERIGDEQFVKPNLAIQLYSSNVKKIYGTNVPGRNGIWILPSDIKFIEGYMDGSYMYSAKFRARIPIDHAKPADGGGSTITANLYLYKSNHSEDILDYNWRMPEYDTWVKYLTYMGTVDADGDGFDDRTGYPIDDGRKPVDTIKDDKPNKEDYEDNILGTISFYFDSFIWYIKQPFVFIADLIGNIIDWISTTIDSWIDSFTSIFTRLFSFLPAEVILMLALGFATMMIITIIRAIRGS